MLIYDGVSKKGNVVFKIFFAFLKICEMCAKLQVKSIAVFYPGKKCGEGNFTPTPCALRLVEAFWLVGTFH